MTVRLSDAEPWRPSDPDFKRHQTQCFICNHNGEPSKDAYRPHTLDTACWCRKKGARCRCAVEWNVSPLETEGEFTRCGLSTMAIA